MKAADKLATLTDEQLIALSKELRQTTVDSDALIREVIRETELETTAPMLAFVGVGQLLAMEVTDRFEKLLKSKKKK